MNYEKLVIVNNVKQLLTAEKQQEAQKQLVVKEVGISGID
jgi:hypothetical protein